MLATPQTRLKGGWARTYASTLSHRLLPERSNDYFRWYPKRLSPHYRYKAGYGHISGVYVHVPFCDRLCKFCPYYKVRTTAAEVDSFVDSLLNEISLHSRRMTSSNLQFIYFGGGSPSVLGPEHFEIILSSLEQTFSLGSQAEISIEVHPSHATTTYLNAIKSAGVTRVSIGVQSFMDERLRLLGATHSGAESHRSVESARQRFPDAAIDLLYSYEGQNLEDWHQELTLALRRYGIQHVSLYPLVDSPGLHRSISCPAHEVELALYALQMSHEYGLEPYASCASGGFDVSTAKARCRYELDHWSAPQSAFVGLGPGAFGFTGRWCTVNVMSLDAYRALIASEKLPLVSETLLTPDDLHRRYFTLGVKTYDVPLGRFRHSFGLDPETVFDHEFERLTEDNLAVIVDETLSLTDIGKLFVDSCSSLFWSGEEACLPHPEEPDIRQLEQIVNLQQ